MLVAETLGRRVVPLRVRVGGGRTWLALGRRRAAADRRALVREAASIAALCEVAEESAGGGDLPELRARLAELRETDNPDGIEEAEAAAASLAETLQPEPRVASSAYLDAIGVRLATARAGARRKRRLSLRHGDAGRGRRGRGADRRRGAEPQAAADLGPRLPLPHGRRRLRIPVRGRPRGPHARAARVRRAAGRVRCRRRSASSSRRSRSTPRSS